MTSAGRYPGQSSVELASGWALQRLTAPSRLYGANGLRTGADGRIYVAQVSGSQISAIDVDTGSVETVSPMGGAIVAPDDLVFDPQGNLFVTEISEGRVSMLSPNGVTRVICADMPVANPITFHDNRLYAGECRPGGRIMQLDLNGGAPRVLLDNVPMPNAMDVGPDGKLYFPVMAANEIWRISLEGGAPEVVATQLGVPDSVKFHPDGYIVSTQVHSGEVLRIDPQTGERVVLARLTSGLDNVTFVGRRIFVSNISGYIVEILGDGKTRELVPDGFNWPMGLAMGADGALFVADGAFSYALRPGQEREILGMLFSQGYPGYARGVAAEADGSFLVTTATGGVMRYQPAQHSSEVLATGLDQPYGVAAARGGAAIVAEQGAGRVVLVRDAQVEPLATGLRKPCGVAVDGDGDCYVSESAGGRVMKIVRGQCETVLDGLQQPQGLLLRNGLLYVVDAGSKQVIEYDVARRARRVIASGLPVGAPPGVVPKPIGPIGNLSGPMGPLAGIAAGSDGTLYVSCDGDGSVVALKPQ